MANGRCRMHGGASTGARTTDGLARIVRANLTHGRQSAKSLALRREIRANYLRLRDIVRAAKAEARADAALHREMMRRFGR